MYITKERKRKNMYICNETERERETERENVLKYEREIEKRGEKGTCSREREVSGAKERGTR